MSLCLDFIMIISQSITKVPFKESLFTRRPYLQLKQDQVLSKWMGEILKSQKLLAELAIKLHISNQQHNLKWTSPWMLLLMLK